MPLVNASQMLKEAKEGKYAIPHININNLEWAKAVLLTAQAEKSPVIIATSEGALKYMGGFKVVSGMLKGLIEGLKIDVPVALHLDHGSYSGVKEALQTEGFTSVMFDGSHFPFEENYQKTAELVEIAKQKGYSFEAEVGTIGGEEDGIVGDGEFANPNEAQKMASLGIDVLAAGIGNIHGPYPKSWKSLSFETLQKISDAAKIGIVLHGGSGIPKEQIQKAISLGVTKINVNTELQQANHKAIREFILAGKDLEGKNFDPRKLYKPGFDAMCAVVKEKIHEFGSNNKA
ncbi:class II fructose-1,6-bisphosphate aldolase [Mycoplasmopsis citelli]|uniref:class II fructose-1,6-bisphosphate aldolase n=1 Tax=Mycoplasmopsis citelli TaxID=171281 RepID=UPI002113BBA8|nr:class II fructose-1,6-bisphosphate aldolase [Mycoplasmopsis citelli]UUD35859.1 class II fructose-1,6-bisphosphate aldolase [Mycoplasmopsis citelli]